LGLDDRGVEACNELALAVGFADPTALFGVFCEGFDVGALGCEDG
jgi:hypothetical protein